MADGSDSRAFQVPLQQSMLFSATQELRRRKRRVAKAVRAIDLEEKGQGHLPRTVK